MDRLGNLAKVIGWIVVALVIIVSLKLLLAGAVGLGILMVFALPVILIASWVLSRFQRRHK
jgi:hypothetical protein